MIRADERRKAEEEARRQEILAGLRVRWNPGKSINQQGTQPNVPAISNVERLSVESNAITTAQQKSQPQEDEGIRLVRKDSLSPKRKSEDINTSHAVKKRKVDMDGDGLAYKRTAGHPPNSRPAMQPKPTTQQKVYNTDARHVETIYKNKGSARQPLDHHSASKRKPVTQQIHRPGVLDFDVPNLAGKKRQAEEDLPEKDPKKGKAAGAVQQEQSTRGGKPVANTTNSTAPRRSFFGYVNRNNPHYIPVTETTSRIRRQVVKVKAPQGTHRRSAVHETSTSKPDSGKAKIIQPGETRDNAVLPSAKPVTSGKKRQAEDEPEVANAKKLKLSGLEASGMHGPKDNAKTPTATDEVSGSKDTHSRRSRPTRNIAPRSSQGKTPETLGLEPTTEADLESVPKGMRNHSHCCFANAGIQCLSGAAEFSAIYEGQAGGTLEDLESLIVSTKDLDRKGKATRKLSSKRHQFRAILKGIKESIAVGPYLGEVLKLLRAKGGEASVSSFVFLQACGVLFEDKGVPLDGETMQDTMHFLGELLKQLDHEERAAQAEDVYSPTLVEDLFGVDVATKLQCTECGLTKDVPSSPTADRFQISAVLPRDQKATTLRALLEGARSKQSRAGYVCDHCKKPDVTMEDSYIKHTSKYLIVQARRAVYTLGKQGRLLLNKNGEAIPEKLKTKVNVPAEAFDVAALCGNGTTVEGAPGARYEVFGVVTHEGDYHDDGHYVALRKINGQWWHLSDEKVTKVPEKDLADHDMGQIFFLSRLD